MRNFPPVPGEYTSLIEGENSRILDLCRRDHYRRTHGLAPLIDDILLDSFHAKEVAVSVGDARIMLKVSSALGVATVKQERKRRKRSA